MALDKSDKLTDINTDIKEPTSNYYDNTYSPGETKQQLRVGYEVKGATSNTSIGNFNISSAGYISITGVGFKPKLVKINATVSSTTGPMQSIGVSNITTNSCHIIFISSTTGKGSAFFNDRIIHIEDQSVVPYSKDIVYLNSLDTDGFTLLVDTRNHFVQCSYECYA